MSEYDFVERDSSDVQQATLCFLVKDNKVLLAMKKRGFGEGLWNGVGGKVKDETIEEALKREAKEEIGVELVFLDKVALIHFYFPDEPEKEGWNQDVHVFLVTDWKGKPEESEEMKPQWFQKNKLPLEKMWDDDKYWLPEVLSGKKIEAWFAFDSSEKIIQQKIAGLK